MQGSISDLEFTSSGGVLTDDEQASTIRPSPSTSMNTASGSTNDPFFDQLRSLFPVEDKKRADQFLRSISALTEAVQVSPRVQVEGPGEGTGPSTEGRALEGGDLKVPKTVTAINR